MNHDEINAAFNARFGQITGEHFAAQDRIRGVLDLPDEGRQAAAYEAADRANKQYQDLLAWRRQQVEERRQDLQSELSDAPASPSAAGRFEQTLQKALEASDDGVRALAQAAKTSHNEVMAKAVMLAARQRGLHDAVATAVLADPDGLGAAFVELGELPTDHDLTRSEEVRFKPGRLEELRPDAASATRAGGVQAVQGYENAVRAANA